MTRSSAARAQRIEATPPPGTIFQPGRNCWRIARADRFRCVQDAADYFALVRGALLSARQSVFILGWDILAAVDLLPKATGAVDGPTRLDELLAFIARRRPRLRCYILIWDYAAVYALERDPLSRWRLGWRMPRHVRFRFDDRHPVGGSHHQKIVVVDDRLAFCGGIDLTGHRWDTSEHRVDEPARVNAAGEPYTPYHEVQAMVSGPAAGSLGELARDRWRALDLKRLPPLRPSPDDLWPSDVPADLTDVDVAISRTTPALDDQPAIRECEALYLDSIAAARRSIYIESQYFTNETIADALAARLAEPDGPEVLIVSPAECEGWLERNTMGTFRAGVFRRLLGADRYKRLRLVHPVASRARNVATFVHSKVMVVDESLVRIGSANISRRSMGVDTECDVAVDAAGNRQSAEGVREIRNRLLAEHLGIPADAVAAELEKGATLCGLVDAHQHGDHTLVPLELPPETEVEPSDALRAAADPDEPILSGADTLEGRRSTRWTDVVTAVLLLAGVAALLWHTAHDLTPLNATLAVVATVLLVTVAIAFRAALLVRQRAPALRRQRQRAEFG
jgi:phosphatidylserine/phosphatidylglycerophosphate/cardiolipin synthase-like enzyme